MIRLLANTRCFIPNSRICFRIIAVGPISVHSTMASTPDLQSLVVDAGSRYPRERTPVRSPPDAKATGGVAEFDHPKTLVAVVNPQDSNALQPQFCVDMSRERISLARLS
jgi:hypothetical protein